MSGGLRVTIDSQVDPGTGALLCQPVPAEVRVGKPLVAFRGVAGTT